MLDLIGKRLLVTVVGMASALVAGVFLPPDRAASFQDFTLKVIGLFIAGQSATDAVESWKSKKGEV